MLKPTAQCPEQVACCQPSRSPPGHEDELLSDGNALRLCLQRHVSAACFRKRLRLDSDGYVGLLGTVLKPQAGEGGCRAAIRAAAGLGSKPHLREVSRGGCQKTSSNTPVQTCSLTHQTRLQPYGLPATYVVQLRHQPYLLQHQA